MLDSKSPAPLLGALVGQILGQHDPKTIPVKKPKAAKMPTRRRRSEAEIVAAICKTIAENPGIGPTELCYLAGLCRKRTHVRILELAKSKTIVLQCRGSKTFLWPNVEAPVGRDLDRGVRHAVKQG